ncbi:FtsH protease activity modulator HflK [Methylobacterium sp. E-041]|uniref:FtsH protease activity modulator HflK n=2 Tax=Methylobacterium TaxID=407 RepID=UPI0011C93671|nr:MULTISPECIES: FtsH protease activity modulator HflK [unclassified Methylobacterium]MCJ2074604.1 FtsH protease activity modulator HflK [Methylobacterium sp. E-016]MCJ2104781.1 FtsH protease activity modulator HflK [Methylobacterium sp. E-041]MCJ2113113.1 FtsH protease activity modulator HflK [Methylobacterium sp. E-025]TXM89893.1 FtsH protease activity modulator HflK [Methylobacterium sp. WL116]TXN39452.1 FtsH protease activity modulator HflK [Methylobacterium sp. WL93]
MPWSNQSGGSGGGGGPWGRGGGGNGGGPWGSGGGGGGKTPPNLEDLLRRGQDRLRGVMPGGSLGGGKSFVVIGALAVGLWLATGFYTVAPNQVGIETIFGRYVGSKGEGLRYNFPYPVGGVIKPNVGQVNSIQVGFRSGGGTQARSRDMPDESLMLTGDENIVDLDFEVQWRVNPLKASDYVFNLQNPEGTIKAIAESAMREVVGRRNIQAILTNEQSSVAQEVKEITQNALDEYGAGVRIEVVQLVSVNPPPEVRPAFIDVNAAQQDADTAQNEAKTYASREVPQARGRASQIVQAAEAYKTKATADATGQAARFDEVYASYKTAPAISRERIFLETMEKVLGSVNKVIIDQGVAGSGATGAAGVVPVLPLAEFGSRTPAPAQTNGAAR